MLCTATLVIVPAVVVAKPASGVKWVPLNQSQNGPAKKSASTESAIETSRSAQSASSPEVAQHQPATTAPSAPQAPSGPLQLTCLGAGTANKLKSTSVFGSGNQSGIIGSTLYSGNSSGSATIIGTQDRPFEDQVDLRLFNGDDRIRMPRYHVASDSWRERWLVQAEERGCG